MCCPALSTRKPSSLSVLDFFRLMEQYTNFTSQGKRRRWTPVIPDPCVSDVEADRFVHRDIPRLSDRQLWAEKHLIDLELAHVIAYGKPRLIFCVNELVNDQQWLEERSRRLQTELRRRREAGR